MLQYWIMVMQVGLVGCGAWGSNILRDLMQLGCAVCVADIDPLARERASRAGARGVCDSADALPDCHGYVVAVPIPSLAPESAVLLRRRKPVFAEKTLCLSLRDYEMLRALGGEDSLFAMHKWHYHPGIEALRAVAASGRIGQLEMLSTVRHAWVKDFHGGDVFWTQAVHDLTIIKHILGEIPSSVQAINVISDNGLPAAMHAVIGSAPAAVMSVSGRHCTKRSGVSIHGSRGSAELRDALDDHIVLQTEEGAEAIAIDTTYPLYLELREFVGYLAGGPRPRCSLESAKEVTQALLGLRRAAAIQP